MLELYSQSQLFVFSKSRMVLISEASGTAKIQRDLYSMPAVNQITDSTTSELFS